MKAFILHHANRAIKDFAFGQFVGDFYRVKDVILRKHGKAVGYDVQHIEGKKCFKCKGTGLYPKWDQYSIYDPDVCWYCYGTGWFKKPQWICLERIAFGKYIFLRPLKREYCVKNPFTKESLGWEVSENKIISGYVDHNPTWIGRYAIALIMINTPDFKLICRRIIKEWKWYWQRRLNRFKHKTKTKSVNQIFIGEDPPF